MTTIEVDSDGNRWWLPGHSVIVRGPLAVREQGGSAGREKERPRRSEHSEQRINVNAASQEELELLPGVGQVIVRRIIEGRPYRTVVELLMVKGIGAKRLEEIRGLVGVR